MTIDNHLTVQNKALEFESLYVALRAQEGRLYTDEELALLPVITPAHRHAGEWQVRQRSCTELVRYLAGKAGPLRILEVGCGNGWLAHQVAKQVPGSTVWALDVNGVELDQARRVFGTVENLHFLQGDPFSGVLGEQTFDVVVLAAAVQYFPSLRGIIDRCLQLAGGGGEVHLLDTHLYGARESLLAKQRSDRYFTSVGFPGMQAFYHHHLLADIKPWAHRILYDPRSLVNKLFHRPHPFYWICIYNHSS